MNSKTFGKSTIVEMEKKTAKLISVADSDWK